MEALEGGDGFGSVRLHESPTLSLACDRDTPTPLTEIRERARNVKTSRGATWINFPAPASFFHEIPYFPRLDIAQRGFHFDEFRPQRAQMFKYKIISSFSHGVIIPYTAVTFQLTV
jgi:hypothetical protein